MLKGIDKIISPDLLKIMMEMGHGDEIVISDGNFPAASIAQRLVRLDGHNAPEVIEAMLKLLPLDTYAEITGKYTDAKPEFLERYEFYERAKNAYAVVYTGESALYANVILKKGVVTD